MRTSRQSHLVLEIKNLKQKGLKVVGRNVADEVAYKFAVTNVLKKAWADMASSCLNLAPKGVLIGLSAKVHGRYSCAYILCVRKWEANRKSSDAGARKASYWIQVNGLTRMLIPTLTLPDEILFLLTKLLKPKPSYTISLNDRTNPHLYSVKQNTLIVHVSNPHTRTFSPNTSTPAKIKHESEFTQTFALDDIPMGTVITISWNCRGVESPLIGCTLMELKKEFCHCLFFVMETKNQK